jgi:hypothetical protein
MKLGNEPHRGRQRDQKPGDPSGEPKRLYGSWLRLLEALRLRPYFGHPEPNNAWLRPPERLAGLSG